MLDAVRLQDFKPHRDTRIALDRFTVLTGANGAGKSTALEAIQALSQVGLGTITTVFTGPRTPDAMVRRGPDAGDRFCLTATVDGEELFVRSSPTPPSLVVDAPTSPLWRAFSSCASLRLNARSIASLVAHRAGARVDYEGLSVSSVLADMKLADDDRFRAIEESLAKILPAYRSIKIRPADTLGPRRAPGFKFALVDAARVEVSAEFLGDGALFTVATLTALFAPDRPRLLLIDDLDQGLHPDAQRALVDVVRGEVERDERLQVVASARTDVIPSAVPAEWVRTLR